MSHDNFPDLYLWKAIRMSISLPWIFTPVEHDNNLYIDGGVMDNYPISIFNDNIDDVIGIIIEDNSEINNLNNIETYTLSVLKCFFKGSYIFSKNGYEKYTLVINLDSVNILDYNMDDNLKKKIYEIGYNTAKKYIISLKN